MLKMTKKIYLLNNQIIFSAEMFLSYVTLFLFFPLSQNEVGYFCNIILKRKKNH